MAQATDEWTLEQLHRLPGKLFVTPPPSVAHEELAAAQLTIDVAQLFRETLA